VVAAAQIMSVAVGLVLAALEGAVTEVTTLLARMEPRIAVVAAAVGQILLTLLAVLVVRG
jgi:hypothetical protein